MQVLCMQKKDSTLPLCHMHNVPLKQQQIAIDANAPSLGRITCYMCPVSHSVVRETRRAHASNAY
jgi:glyoxylate carboligase